MAFEDLLLEHAEMLR